MEEKNAAGNQKVNLINRQTCSIGGVRDVVSFDENQVILDTDLGLLTIKGKSLHMNRLSLDKGETDLEGSVDSLAYSSNEAYRRSGESFFNRLFK